MSNIAPILDRNHAFGRTDARQNMPVPFIPRLNFYIVSCIDCRVDPAETLQIKRRGFALRVGIDERTLADTPVLDPARTVRTDVERVLWAAEIPPSVLVSGHVYDVQTGLVTTVVDAKSKKQASQQRN